MIRDHDRERGPHTIITPAGSLVASLTVQELIQRAIRHDDAAAMRQAVERLFAHGEPGALSPEAEYELRHPDYVMEMPHSGERIRGRENMRAMQEAFPTPPSITIRRVTGAAKVWVLEGINDYAGDVWHAIVVFEFDDPGRIVRDTRYYGQPFEAPAWRSPWVESI
jgi:hypothetical protein